MSYFIVIPDEILQNQNILPMQKILYGEISSLSNASGFASAKNAYFAKKYGFDENTIRRHLRKLEDLKIIDCDYENGERRIWIKPQSTSFKSRQEIIDLLNDHQKERYLNFETVFPEQTSLIINTLADAYFSSEFLNKKIGNFILKPKLLELLIAVFDIGKCGGLVKTLRDNFAEIQNPPYYIMVSILNEHEIALNRAISKERRDQELKDFKKRRKQK